MSVGATESAKLPISDLRVTVILPTITRQLRWQDLQDPADVFQTPAQGSALVQVAIVGDTTASATRQLSLGLRSDWEYNVFIRPDSTDPADSTCTDCIGSQAFPLPVSRQRSDGDSLWLFWKGRAASNNAVN